MRQGGEDRELPGASSAVADATDEPDADTPSEADADEAATDSRGDESYATEASADLDSMAGDGAGTAQASPFAGPPGGGTPKRYGNPVEALRFAEQQRRRAEKARDNGEAIRLALEGWRAVAEHPGHPGCEACARGLIAMMTERDQAAVSGRPIDDLPLKIQ